MSLEEVQQRIVELAKSYVGIKEVGKNAGFSSEDFEARMRKLGWIPGQAWCAYFAKLLWLEAYQGSEIHSTLKNVLSGGVIQTFRNAKGSPLLKVADMPVVGGLVLFEVGAGKGHEGVCITVRDEFRIGTVEGNTNAVGSRDGDGVLERQRSLDVNTKKWRYLGCIHPPEFIPVL